MTWLLSLPGKIAAAFGAALFAALMFVAGKGLGKGEGREDAEQEAMANAAKRVERGRDAVADGRERGGPDDRLRDNDGHW